MKGIVQALKNLVFIKQKDEESLSDYQTRFKDIRNQFKTQYGGKLHLTKYAKQLDSYDTNAPQPSYDEAWNHFISYLFITTVDQSKYGSVVTGITSQYSLGNDQFPKTLEKAVDCVSNHPFDKAYKEKMNQKKKQQQSSKSSNSSVATPKAEANPSENQVASLNFAQLETRCWCCGKKGHISPQCPLRNLPKEKWAMNQNKNVQLYQSVPGTVPGTVSQTAIPEDSASVQEGGVSVSNTTIGTTRRPGWMMHQVSMSQNNISMDTDSPKFRNHMKNILCLDSCSSVDLFCNPCMVQDVKPSNDVLDLATNAGTMETTKQATLPNYGKVWFDERAITNVFSLARLADKYRVVMDSAVENAIMVHTPNGVIKFSKGPEYIYYYKPSEHKKVVQFLSTVKDAMRGYTPRQIARAKLARRLQESLSFPTTVDLKKVITMNAIADCPVTLQDVNICEKIFGPSVAALKGKTTRQRMDPVVEHTVEIPRELLEAQKKVHLCFDVMFVNSIPFFVSISKHIHYRYGVHIKDNKEPELHRALKETIQVYHKAGFQIAIVSADPEFYKLRQEWVAANNTEFKWNLGAAGEHQPDIERSNRVVKERIRSTFHSLPFTGVPKKLVPFLVLDCIRKLNYFPSKGGCSPYYSPRMIVERKPLNYEHHCKHPFLQYVEAHDDPQFKQGTQERTISALYVWPLDNLQGGHKVYDLSTREFITRKRITSLPMPDSVISKVNSVVQRDKVYGLVIRSNRGQVLYDSAKSAGVDYTVHQPMEQLEAAVADEYDNLMAADDQDSDSESEDESVDDSEDETDVPELREPVDMGEDDDIDDDQIAGVQEDAEQDDTNSDDDNASEQVQEPVVHYYDVEEVDPIVPDDEEESESSEDDDDQSESEDDQDDVPLLEQNYDSIAGRTTRSGGSFVQTSKRKSKVTSTKKKAKRKKTKTVLFTHREAIAFVNIMQQLSERFQTRTVQHGTQCLTTYSLRKGIAKFGEAGVKSAHKEVKQIHDRDCIRPILKSDLNPTERSRVMEAVTFMLQKHDGTVKTRTCVNGSTQRSWMTRAETSSPTVATESLFLTAVIDAEEGRDVGTVDIPNAFVQVSLDSEDEGGHRTIMRLRGDIVDILCSVDESYTKFVVTEGKKQEKVIYLHVVKALYGMLESAMLFYKKLLSDLEKFGFKANPYDPCVANKMVNGHQMTVCWHVDDVKVSHKDPKEVDSFIDWVVKTYGKIGEVKAVRGKKHTYLGMVLDYSVPGQVSIDMTRYVNGMLEQFPQEWLKGSKVKSPWSDKLFSVDEKSNPLSQDKKEIFHTTTAQGLFACKRARPDISPAIAFLTTRVRSPTEEDWNKLVRMMKFLEQTKDDVLTLRSDGKRVGHWHVDASFAVHPDFRSHTGATFTLGEGSITSISRKQGMNTRSSTEAEVVAADEVVGPMVWTTRFLEAQGYVLNDNILYQDNQSAMLLEKNGRSSAGKRSRHLNIRYFFVKDQRDNGLIDIRFCPTDNMTADYMTKPLHGAKFDKFRSAIMNIRTTAAHLFMLSCVGVNTRKRTAPKVQPIRLKRCYNW